MNKQEKKATTIMGGFATAALILSVYGPNMTDAARVFYFGVSLSSIAMAISPNFLFTKLTKGELSSRKVNLSWVSQVLVIASLFFYLAGLIIWFIQ